MHQLIESEGIWIPNHYSLLLPPTCIQLFTAFNLDPAFISTSLPRQRVSSSSLCSSQFSHSSCADRTLFPDEDKNEVQLP